jgi:hypothetical protein
MGLGKEAAERLKEQADQEQERLAERGKQAMLTEQNRQGNWDRLVATLQKDVEEFVENFPWARTQVLRADLLNSNNLTIQTMVQPLLKVEIVRDNGYSGVVVSVMRQRGYEDAVGNSPTYGYTPEGFTDGSSVYTPERFATEIFEHVTDFFSASV